MRGRNPLFSNQSLVFKVKCLNCASVVHAVTLTQLSENLSHIILKPNRLVGIVVRDIVISTGRDGCISPSAIFKHVFDEYSFSIIMNLFDNNKPYALSTHNRKCKNKMHHIWCNTQSDLGAKILYKICLKIVQKVLKWPLQHVNFQKCFGGVCPQNLFYSQYASK